MRTAQGGGGRHFDDNVCYTIIRVSSDLGGELGMFIFSVCSSYVHSRRRTLLTGFTMRSDQKGFLFPTSPHGEPRVYSLAVSSRQGFRLFPPALPPLSCPFSFCATLFNLLVTTFPGGGLLTGECNFSNNRCRGIACHVRPSVSESLRNWEFTLCRA